MLVLIISHCKSMTFSQHSSIRQRLYRTWKV
jgi:hypothetical protein